MLLGYFKTLWLRLDHFIDISKARWRSED
ncbi:hypothetical protein E2C01_084138 [Portunus trituberculatus]|uniref:Uncharacterized protein n=1 Tax=Portunus trituberculatus TaxID=210409 RepID=A0A5B7IZ50_PORTR|nr:hypothetical protein [Portunus trituberculatus]